MDHPLMRNYRHVNIEFIPILSVVHIFVIWQWLADYYPA